MRLRAVIALVLAATLALALNGPGPQSPARAVGEYKIGVLEPLDRPARRSRASGTWTPTRSMRDMVNARGGVMGKKLVFAVGDATDPTAAASEATRLITREGVKIITGTYSSTLCGAASEAAARAQRHLLGDVLRGPALQPARAQDRVPHRDRRAPGSAGTTSSSSPSTSPALQHAAQSDQGRLPLRGLLLRPGRDGVGPAAGQAGVRHAGGGGRVLRLRLHQRLHARSS